MYVFRLGVLDGRPGWLLCNFIASYELSVQLKLRELRRLRASGVSSIAGLKLAEGQLNDLWVKRNGNQLPPPPTLDRAALGSLSDSSAGLPAPLDKDAPFRSPWTLKQNVGRALWMISSAVLFRLSFHNWYAWRRLLLRIFGARIGRGVRIRPSVKIEIPWNLTIDDQAVVGDDAILYCLGPIHIGRRVVISQYAHLCAGTHDFDDPTFPLVKPPITIGDNCWIAADAFVGPGVIIGPNTVVGARSSVFKNLPPNVIAAGTPAKVIKERTRKAVDPIPDTPVAAGA
jgi:putative colanic acid biosynthesis acetyltransferase WcaF